MWKVNISDIYPANRWYIYGTVQDCSSEKIILTNGRVFDFSFPGGSLRQQLPIGTKIVLKVSATWSVKEYYVIQSSDVKKSVQDTLDRILNSPVAPTEDFQNTQERWLNGLGHPEYL